MSLPDPPGGSPTFEPPNGGALPPPPAGEAMVQPVLTDPPVTVPVMTDDPPSRRQRNVALVAVLLLIAAALVVVFAIALLRNGGDSGYDFDAAAERVNTEPSRVVLTTDTGLMGDITVEGESIPADGRSSISMQLGDMFDLEAIVDAPSETIFLGSEFLADLVPGGLTGDAGWVRIDAEQASAVPGFEELITAIEQNDLSGSATSLLQKASSVQELGIEEIDGEQLQHVVATIPFDAFIEVSPDIEQQLEQLGVDAPDSFEIDVWITEDDWVRKMSYSLELGPMQLAIEAVITELPDDFTIELPAEGDYIDLADLIPG